MFGAIDLQVPRSTCGLYASGGQGSLRYVFLHGNHANVPHVPLPEEVIVEGKVVVLDRAGSLVMDSKLDGSSSHYHFVNGRCEAVDDQRGVFLPARELVETLLKNVSVPGLVLAEVPMTEMGLDTNLNDPYLYIAILVLGRSDQPQIRDDDRNYLIQMMENFVPRFTVGISFKSNEYLPGDARSLCREVGGYMRAGQDDDSDSSLNGFLDLYYRRYIHRSVMSREEILESCLLHILKMPFELRSSIVYGLIRQ